MPVMLLLLLSCGGVVLVVLWLLLSWDGFFFVNLGLLLLSCLDGFLLLSCCCVWFLLCGSCWRCYCSYGAFVVILMCSLLLKLLFSCFVVVRLICL